MELVQVKPARLVIQEILEIQATREIPEPRVREILVTPVILGRLETLEIQDRQEIPARAIREILVTLEILATLVRQA